MSDLVLDGIVIPNGSNFQFNYEAARWDRFRDWTLVGAGMPMGEWQSLPQWERHTITARLRYLIRNNEYCAALATTFVTHLGNSTLRSKSPDKTYNTAKENLWVDWSGACEVSGLSIEEVEDIIYTELLCAGEIFFLKLANGKIQMVPSEWVRSDEEYENEIQGITYNSTGIPQAYRIGYRDDNGAIRAGKKTVPAAQVIHLYKRDRVEQLRGVPLLAAATNPIQDIAELTKAKVASVKAQSHLSAAIIKSGGGSAFPLLGDTANVASAPGDTTNVLSRYATLKSGSLIYLNPGEDIKTISTAYQSSDFEAFLLSRLRAVGATIGMPLELFLEGYRESNYSSARATQMVWARKVKSLRNLIERRFLQPLNVWVSQRARSSGTLKGNRSYDSAACFTFPAIPSIDEAKEAAANGEKLAAGLTSYSTVYAENNQWFEDEIAVRARDIRLIFDAAKAEDVDPQLLAPALFAPKQSAPAEANKMPPLEDAAPPAAPKSS